MNKVFLWLKKENQLKITSKNFIIINKSKNQGITGPVFNFNSSTWGDEYTLAHFWETQDVKA